ncbi:Histone-lysine N-methyltransferase PRDM9 [Operophtera brumata]|uniref:Histone-lysine N-methyltransferase PRDM9 n=1 Tax=Operophtera brumata TaxID=104452 RepID=A0A0L7KV67_OPEBR|nr:Histone-lysine N-methyltransferase PRDM9 [Operophtera brumata]
MQKHSGVKAFSCDVCSKAYARSYSLREHMRAWNVKHMQKHSGVKAFSCDVCSKAYARSYSLREHMRVHDG